MFDRTDRKARLAVAALAVLTGLLCYACRTFGQAESRDSFVNSRSHDGEVLDADLPGGEHIRNIGSKVDGAGMCVMTSIEMAARWAGLEEYRGLRDWCATQAGGGYPEKVDRQLAAYAQAKGLPPPRYVQYEGADPGAVIGAALKSGRVACITYGWSPRYPGQRSIAHMTCCVHYGQKYAVVLDNNFPGEDRYEWMDPAELARRCKFPQPSGWCFVWLEPPPPPSPRNP